MEHLTQKQVEDYCRRQLPAAELLAVTDHFGGCDLCRQRIELGGNGETAFFQLRFEMFEDTAETVQHLTMEQTAAYVERSVSGEELQMFSDHLTHCEQCVSAVDDLREFRNEIAPSLDREYRPATVPSPIPSPGESSWRRTLRSLVAPFRVSPVPAFGGAALALLLLAVIAWVAFRTPQQQEPQIANAPTPQPTVPPSQPEAPPTQPPTPVVAQVNDGAGTLALDQQGKLSGADDLPPAYQNLVRKALSGGRLEKSAQLQGLTRPGSSLMGSNNQPGEFSVLEPLGSVLLADRATFRWTAMEGASAYVVEVYDEKFAPVTQSPQLTDLTWATTVPRGHVYSWQVKAIKDGTETTSPRPPAPQAKFRILDQAKANELANARRTHPSSHLTLGLLYADAGLLREAEQEFRLLQKANPNSDLARNLLRQVQLLRRS